MLTRRELMATTALMPLAACAGTTPSAALIQAIQDVQTIAAGLAGVLPGLGSIPGIPATVVGKAGSIISEIQAVAQQMAGVTTTAGAQGSVQQLETLLNTLVAAVAPFVAAVPVVGQVFAAAAVLLPVIEAAVGLIVKPAARLEAALTPDQARLILQAAATGR